MYEYELSKFVAMGSTNEPYNESQACDSYYLTDQDIVYENFIFHVNFDESNIQEDLVGNSLLMELQDSSGQTLVGVLGIQRDTTKYSVYTNQDAKINISAELDKDTIYLKDTFTLTLNTDFQQKIIDTKSIYDTHFFNQKMGIKITIYDNTGNQLNNDTLLGVNFLLDGERYYPRIDGTTRIKISDRISNVLSKIKIDTSTNTTLATGTYTIKVETFGSPDGIYYGLEASDYVEKQITIINGQYGLKVTTDDKSKIIDKETGNTLNGNNSIISFIEYSSNLDNPQILVSLYRRTYTDIYSKEYELIDLKDYVSNQLNQQVEEKHYLVTSNPTSNNMFFLNLNENIRTGTYKLVFSLYDGNKYIGEAYEYFIVK